MPLCKYTRSLPLLSYALSVTVPHFAEFGRVLTLASLPWAVVDIAQVMRQLSKMKTLGSTSSRRVSHSRSFLWVGVVVSAVEFLAVSAM